MASALTHCRNCGAPYESVPNGLCPQCGIAPLPHPPMITDATSVPGAKSTSFDILVALLVWFGSVGLLLIIQLAGLIIYYGIKYLQTGEMPRIVIDAPFALVSLAGTFVAHILTLGLCWVVVTRKGQEPFWSTLGWRWHTQFKWVHAVALAIGMFGLAILMERVLPHGETDFDRLLRLSLAVRISIAVLAVLTAPIVEEVVYRGVIYGAFERAGRLKLGILIVTLLFATVHVPQYWGSPASLAAILLISLVLTLLRALTRQLLPSVATHFVFNGVQALILLLRPAEAEKVDAGLAILKQFLGLG